MFSFFKISHNLTKRVEAKRSQYLRVPLLYTSFKWVLQNFYNYCFVARWNILRHRCGLIGLPHEKIPTKLRTLSIYTVYVFFYIATSGRPFLRIVVPTNVLTVNTVSFRKPDGGYHRIQSLLCPSQWPARFACAFTAETFFLLPSRSVVSTQVYHAEHDERYSVLHEEPLGNDQRPKAICRVVK
jgi:hypothetical protein